ncbi:MAG: SulP family inorganic anion transporter [Opitutales bacterium]
MANERSVPRTPSAASMQRYVKQSLRSDAAAGLTVAVMGVPQAMAYALIAGLPPVYGLYTAMVTCTVAALSGSSNHLITGPTNALSLVILSLTVHLPAKYDVELLETILLLTLMVGLIQLGFGLLRFGGIIRYVSNSVVVGFTAGAGLLIAAGQLRNLLGVEIRGGRFFEVLWQTLQNIHLTNPFALLVGVLTALCLLLLPRVNRLIPASLVGVAAGGILVYAAGWYRPEMGAWRVQIIRDIEPIRAGLDLFHVPELLTAPNWQLAGDLLPGAMALALLGLIEAAAIGRAIAAHSGQRLDFNREFVGQGIGNLTGSFFSCFAGSGSFARTAVCHQAGGKTRGAALFSALWTALTVLLLAPVANFIPQASLAGLLMVVAYKMIDRHRMMLAWQSGWRSQLVLFGTFGSTLILPLEYAIFVGILLSIIILLQVTARTDLTQLVPRPDGAFDEVPFQRAAPSPVVTVNMEGDLYFAAAEDLDYELLRCITPETRVVILRMKRLRAVGSTAMAMLEHFYHLLHAREIWLVVCGIEDELKFVMTHSGLRREIGEENIFYADNRLFQSTELAIARAWSLVHREQRLKRELGKGAPPAPEATVIQARNILNRKVIRFGSQHQLREAIWLMSGMHKQLKATRPHVLFLQNKEGKLAGSLSPQRIFLSMSQALTHTAEQEDSEKSPGERLIPALQQSIFTLARKDIPELESDATLEELLKAMIKGRHIALPICDPEGRIEGLITAEDLLRGVHKALSRMKEKEEQQETS